VKCCPVSIQPFESMWKLWMACEISNARSSVSSPVLPGDTVWCTTMYCGG